MKKRICVQTVCAHCGRDFLARIEQLRKGEGRFCSLSCSARGRPRPDRAPTATVKRTRRNDSSKGWRSRNPAKVQAQQKLNRALRLGRITRPAACQRCGEPKRLQGHHDDYHKPLDVQWLCALCHRRRHAELDRAGHTVPTPSLAALTPRTKATAEQVVEIRRRASEGETMRSLAKTFRLSSSQICRIVLRQAHATTT